MISYIAPINSLGYGVASLGILKSLSKLHPVSFWPIGSPDIHTQEDFNVVSNCVDNSKMFDPDAPCLRIWHQNQMDQFVGRGEKIGFPIFELDRFNEVETHHLSNLDRIFVTSEWAKTVIIDNGIDQVRDIPVDVIPLGVDTSLFQPVQPNNDGPTIFFNCGKWEVRKGHDVLIDAFKQAFSEDDNVELWMMCTNPFNSEEENAYWHSKYSHPKVKLVNRVQSHTEVYNIMSQVDCGVFPARAEGWNLEALELLACGKHLIITDYAAHTEYCNHLNSMLININETDIAYDGKWFFGQGDWAKLGEDQINQLSQYMRLFHDNRINGKVDINQAGIDTANKFTWDHSARRILEVLNV